MGEEEEDEQNNEDEQPGEDFMTDDHLTAFVRLSFRHTHRSYP